MTDPAAEKGCPPGACSSCTQNCPSAGKDGAAPASPPPASTPPDPSEEDRKLAQRLSGIRHRILVMSGKGGVGKSTVATNLALSLHRAGKRVGLLDVDIHGPSIPGMLRLEKTQVQAMNGSILPLDYAGLKVMSIGFLLPGTDDAVIWRGPMKMTVIRQFLQDVAWGELDVLVIDLPPGTGDEPLSVCQLAAPVDGAVVVTTPQAVSTSDVRRSIRFCERLELPVLGVVENMSGFVCPHCGEVTHIFKQGGGKAMAEDMKVPFLGAIPLDPGIGAASDEGRPYVETPDSTESAKAFHAITQGILKQFKKTEPTEEPT